MDRHSEILPTLDVWHSPIKIARLSGGKTNKNYLVQDNSSSYVARFAPQNSIDLGLDRSREVHNCAIAAQAGIGPRVVREYKELNLLILEYIPGDTLKMAAGAWEPELIERVAHTLCTLHSLENFKGDYDPLADAEGYLSRTKERRAWIPENVDAYAVRLKRRMTEMSTVPPTPCHFDLLLENIIIEPSGTPILIDWEYSHNGDRRFDLAMFILEAKFTEAQQQRFLSAYDPVFSESKPAELDTMKALVSFSIAMYGILQNATSENKSEVDYQAYAESKWDIFKKLMDS